MFIDARTLPGSAEFSSDVCVIGAGPAGLTVARRLAAANAKVIVLESGGESLDLDTQSLAEGEIVGESYWALETSRLRFLGGTSNHWTGWCRPLDASDFTARPWVESSGWPLTLEELTPYYREAQAICDLGEFDYDAERWAARLGTPLLPLDHTAVTSSLWQFSPPTRFGPKYAPEFRASRQVDVFLYANALELGTSLDGRRVERAAVGHLGGGRFTVKAQLFVLAAGGLENARLLLVSGTPPGLGNRFGLVGRYFLEHPHAVVGVLVCSKAEAFRIYESVWNVADGRPPAVRATLAIPFEIQRQERLLNLSVGIEPLAREPPFTRSQVESTLSLARRFQGVEAQASFELLARSEQQPSPDSHVRLAFGKDRLGVPKLALNWRHHPATLRTLRRGVELVGEALGRARIGRVYSYVHGHHGAPGTWPEIFGGHHHMGTTRMHDDPRHGVVDRDCRVHSLENAFVAGSSVFPTGGYANPTLTLVALAARLADTLKLRLK